MILTEDFDITIYKRLGDVYSITWGEYDANGFGKTGPGRQVCNVFNNLKFPAENFPTMNEVMQMMVTELRDQYGCEARIEYIHPSKTYFSWPPKGKPYIYSWLYGTVAIYIVVEKRIF